jgi:3-dehydroquinate dehydratase/shikimate dehydrogenase
MTFIAVVVPVARADQISAALETARLAKRQGADIVEWRVDSLAQEPGAASAVTRLVQDAPMPCIVTVRHVAEGGGFCGTDEQRQQVWTAACTAHPPAAYVDVELATYRSAGRAGEHARDMSKLGSITGASSPRVILSFHDFDGRPTGLPSRIEEMWSDASSAVSKVVWMARTPRDNTEAFDVLATRAKPTIALCMGEHGLLSRVLAPKFGGFLTYARSDAQGTAPGQPTVEELVKQWGFRSIGAQTRVFGVLAHPVAHSRSPALHNRWFLEGRIDARLFAISAGPTWESFKATLIELLSCDALHFSGCAVSLPHKVNAIRFVEERGGMVDAMARCCGAANTITVAADGTLRASNTDISGVRDPLLRAAEALGWTDGLSARRALVIGAGGTGRAAAAALASSGAEVTLTNRTAARAAAVAMELNSSLASVGSALPPIVARSIGALDGSRFDVIVQATSAGMTGGEDADADPLPEKVPLTDRTIAMDLVYTPRETPFLRRAGMAGAHLIEGWSMFIAQAAQQHRLWTGKDPPNKDVSMDRSTVTPSL